MYASVDCTFGRKARPRLLAPEIQAEHIRQLRKNSKACPRDSIDLWWIRVQPRESLRLGELGQLTQYDIRTIHGRPCIDLFHLDDGDPRRRERRKALDLKTLSSRRVVPVVQALIDDGFLEVAEARRKKVGDHGPLFTECEEDHNGKLDAASKRLNRQIDDVVIDPRSVGHSARHSFAASCDAAGVPADVREMFMGHSNGGSDDTSGRSRNRGSRRVRQRYGTPLPSSEQMAWLDRVNFD